MCLPGVKSFSVPRTTFPFTLILDLRPSDTHVFLVHVTDQLIHEDELLVAIGPLAPVHLFLAGWIRSARVVNAEISARGAGVWYERLLDLQERLKVRNRKTVVVMIFGSCNASILGAAYLY